MPDVARCCALIAAGGAVDPESAAAELPRCPVVVLVRSNNEIVGVGAIKRLRRPYAKRISLESGFVFDPAIPELGYVSVDTNHQGHGLSHRIVAELIAQHDGALFATTDDEKMKRALRAAGFSKKGDNWKGNRGELSLWIRGESEPQI